VIVQGPFTREQANALLGIYLDADSRDASRTTPTTGRRITCEEFDPADRDLSEIIPEGEERFSWPLAIFTTAFAVLALYFAFHTFGLQFVTPRAKDAEIAAGLAFVGALFLLLTAGDGLNRAWGRVLAHWATSRRKQPAEVAS
jgi:hypothetical protein